MIALAVALGMGQRPVLQAEPQVVTSLERYVDRGVLAGAVTLVSSRNESLGLEVGRLFRRGRQDADDHGRPVLDRLDVQADDRHGAHDAR